MINANPWLSGEVATGLANAVGPPLSLPVEALALLSALVEARSFRSLYGDSAKNYRLWGGSLDEFPPLDQIGATGPTGLPTHTFGAWQWEPAAAKDISAGIGTPSVIPEKQIRGSWWLAQRDYRKHGGGVLLADLRAAGRDIEKLSAIGEKLHDTWPGGARAGFAIRYLSALPTEQPPPQSTPVPKILLHAGEARLVALVGWNDSGAAEPLPITGGTIIVDDEAVCGAAIDPRGQAVTITERGPGTTTVHYTLAGLRADLEVTVAHLAKIAFDPDRKVDPFSSPAPTG
jgi:hypothetical protein